MSDETKKSPYEMVIGLEVHAHLWTRTKMFCACPRPRQSNIEPNTLTCPVCLGMPGVLPVINEEAVRKALKVALALHCTIPPVTHFDRKNYYYPDLPKNYQISQNYNPLGRDGWMQLSFHETKEVFTPAAHALAAAGPVVELRAGPQQTARIGIDNVHLEEDAGKSVHPETEAGGTSGIDLNRAGTPLLEVVTKPDMRSIEELEAFVQRLRQLLKYLRVSECRMEEGQLRFEVSVSLRPVGQEELGTRVEVKNLNSVRSVLAATEHEAQRQRGLLEEGKKVERETRLWDEVWGETRTMRSKELAHDYRYFPEPDLVPVGIPKDLLDELRAEVAEQKPEARWRSITDVLEAAGWPRPAGALSLDSPITAGYAARLLSEEPETADYFLAMVKAGGEPKQTANWILQMVFRELNERRTTMADFPVSPEQTVKLLGLINKKTITHGIARQVFARMIEAKGGDPEAIVREQGLAQIKDTGELEQAVARVIAENPKPVADFRAGRKQAFAYLVGQVMRVTKGKANPQLARELLERLLAGER